LSSSTVANPQISLLNLSIANDTTFYIVTATNGFGCSETDSVRVIVNHLPVSEAGANINMCSGDTGSLGSPIIAGYSYSWSPTTGLSNSTLADPSITLVNADTIIDTLEYFVTTTVGSCATIDSVTVIVFPSPIVDAGSDISQCSGDIGTIGSTPISGYTYLWSPDTGLSDSTIANPTVSLTNPSIIDDTIYYSVTVTTGFGCIGYDTVRVIIKHLPSSEAGISVSFCSGSSAGLGTSPTTGYSYLWNPTGGLSSSTISNPNVTLVNSDTVPDTTMYSVTTTLSSCSTNDSVQVIVLPLPISDAGTDLVICSEDTANMGSLPKPGYTYLWSPTTGLSDSTISNPTVTLSTADSISDTIIYVVTSIDTASSCVSSDAVQVIVYSVLTTPVIFGSISVCPGADSVSYWLNGDPGSTYQWTVSGNITFGQGTDSILVDWDSIILWTISVIEIDSLSCSGDTSTLNGTTNVLLQPPKPIGPDTLCDNSITGIIYQTIFTNGSIYNWDITGGTITSGNGSNSVTVDWDSAGVAKIWFEETSTTIDTVCTGTSDTLFVAILISPTASSIAGDFFVCEDSIPISYSISGLPASLFTWFINGDTVANAIGLDTVLFVWDSAGTFVIKVIESTVAGCSDSLIDTVTVNLIPQTSAIVGDTTICYDSLGIYPYSVTGFSGSTYQWTISGGSIISTPVINDSILVKWDSAIIGNISVIETSNDSCVGGIINQTITVNPAPQAEKINGGSYFCENSIPEFYSILGLPGSLFTWFINGDTVANLIGLDTISFVWDSEGVFVVSVLETTTGN